MTWRIDFAPRSGVDPIEYSVDGAILTVDGETYDFTNILIDEGDTLLALDIPNSSVWLQSTEVTLWEGKFRLCVVVSIPEGVSLHPDPVEVVSGRVPLPTDGAN